MYMMFEGANIHLFCAGMFRCLNHTGIGLSVFYAAYLIIGKIRLHTDRTNSIRQLQLFN